MASSQMGRHAGFISCVWQQSAMNITRGFVIRVQIGRAKRPIDQIASNSSATTTECTVIKYADPISRPLCLPVLSLGMPKKKKTSRRQRPLCEPVYFSFFLGRSWLVCPHFRFLQLVARGGSRA